MVCAVTIGNNKGGDKQKIDIIICMGMSMPQATTDNLWTDFVYHQEVDSQDDYNYLQNLLTPSTKRNKMWKPPT